ncbi:uncharacterized protein ISCGN_006116 [Ixodes scapularis]
MAKDMTKLMTELKEEFKKECKIMRETLERDLRNELRDIHTELKGINDGMNFINKDFEEFKEKIESVIVENAALQRANTELGEKYDQVAKSLKENEERLLQYEQYSRRHNLEVKGIPKTETESITDLIFQIGNLIGEQITLTDIETCHRVPTREVTKSNVIVQFQRRQKRDAVLDKAKKRKITCRDLGLPDATPVYVNEHLCPTLKRLLGMATSRKREMQWRYVWVRNAKILARKADNAPIVTISDERDLDKIC